jgi:hypothetical protein
MAFKNDLTAAQKLAGELTGWAIDSDVTDDPYVLGLLHAVENRRGLDMWSTLDPFELLPHPEGKSGSRDIRNGRLIAILRNILVFVPVALTWEAVSQATKAFATFVELNGATTVNFLEFWQNGYKILPSFWQIANIAQVDFFIILAVILMSVAASAMNERGSRAYEKEIQMLEKDRIQIGILILEYLFNKGRITPNNVNAKLASSVRNLMMSSGALAESTRRIERTNKTLFAQKNVKREIKKFYENESQNIISYKKDSNE